MRKSQNNESWAVAELEVKYRKIPKMPVTVNYAEKAYKVFLKMWDKSLINVQEQFCVLYLDTALQVLGFRQIGTGSLSSVTVDEKMIFSLALLSRANNIVVAHNHPSGSLKPSKADKEITQSLKTFGNLIGITLQDHLIISDNGHYSFKEDGGML